MFPAPSRQKRQKETLAGRLEQPLHVRIFLSSPGDVLEERRLARKVILILDKQPLLAGKVTLELVAWDDPEAPVPLTAGRTPQDDVNLSKPLPSQCDITIVILWTRLGTQLPQGVKKPDGVKYASGTEWEYLDARSAGRDVLVYFRTEKPAFNSNDPRLVEKEGQLQAVMTFLAQFRNSDGSFGGGYNEYKRASEFGSLLEKHLESLLRRRIDAKRTTGPSIGRELLKAGPTQKIEKPKLRQILVERFNRAELDMLCSDLEHELTAKGIEIRINLDIVGGEGMESICQRLVEFLFRRSQLASLVELIEKLRPGSIPRYEQGEVSDGSS